MTTAHKLLKGSVFRNIDLLLSIGAAFVMTPFIVHTLGERAYGFWILIYASILKFKPSILFDSSFRFSLFDSKWVERFSILD